MRTPTLGSLVLAYEIVFVMLLLLTGALSWRTTSFWYDNSKELGRLNQLLHYNEQIRSALTRQLHFLVRASAMNDDIAITSYNENTRTLDRLFGASYRLTENRQEDQAIHELQQQYRIVQVDMNKIRNARHGRPPATIRMLDAGYAARITSIFDEHHRRWRNLLVEQSETVTRNLERWLKITIILYALLLSFALLLILFTRGTLRRQFVIPMQNLTKGATIASSGNLEHRVPVAGSSETKQLAQNLNVMAEQLAASRDQQIQQEKQAALGALVPVVAHNIRNPMAGIRATVQLFDTDSDKVEINEHKKNIIDTIDRLGRWVSALLSYLHPLQPHYRKCAAASLIQDVTGTLRGDIQRGIELHTGRMDESLMVNADPDLMEQALYALTSNAIEASPDNSKVMLEVFPENDRATIRIVDSGPGIPFIPSNDELIPGHSTKRFGTGLGLPIARKICNTHGWSINFINLREQDGSAGTEVRIQAPLYNDSDNTQANDRNTIT